MSFGTLLFKHLSCVKFRHSIPFILAQLKLSLSFQPPHRNFTSSFVKTWSSQETAVQTNTSWGEGLTLGQGVGATSAGLQSCLQLSLPCSTHSLFHCWRAGVTCAILRCAGKCWEHLNTYWWAYPTCAIYSMLWAPPSSPNLTILQ